nr:ATP-binding protein [Streptomyces sp. VRA16 Mangrove soil]
MLLHTHTVPVPTSRRPERTRTNPVVRVATLLPSNSEDGAGDVVRVEVHDSGGGTAAPREPQGEHGRGLRLVAALADKWGVGERDPGKIVWCEFAGNRAAPALSDPAVTLGA